MKNCFISYVLFILVGLTTVLVSCANENAGGSDASDDAKTSTDPDNTVDDENSDKNHKTEEAESDETNTSTKADARDTAYGTVREADSSVKDADTDTHRGAETDSYGDTGTKSDTTGAYKLIKDSFTTESPSYVKVMFHVTNEEDIPLTNLTAEDFGVEEDSDPVSPTESAIRIRKQDEMPFTLYTVLMLDNSLSVGTDLADIKAAAKALIFTADAVSESDRDGDTESQKFLIYSFSDAPTLLTPTFENDVEALTDAIDSIELGFNSTNLYGAITEGVSQWTDTISEEEGISQGFLVLLTDGRDTQDSSTLSSALGYRRDKKVITVGVGSEIDPEVLASLGNFGFCQIDDYSDLETQFVEIQTNMNKFANSFYWLEYLSPKRGDGNHQLNITVKGNTYEGRERYIADLFESDRFYSVQPGLYINDSPSLPSGITQIKMDAAHDPVLLVFNTYWSADGKIPEPPVYSLTADCTGAPAVDTEVSADNDAGPDTDVSPLLNIEPSETSPSNFVLTSDAETGTVCILTAKDEANGFTTTVTLTVKNDAHGTVYN